MRNEFSERPAPNTPLNAVARTDLLLDALAARAEVPVRGPDDFEDHALATLLGEWRDDLRWPPGSALVSQTEAENALREGMSERRRGRKGLATIGSVAATLVILSGFGAVVADARPGDLLYGLHAMMFNEPRVGDDQIVLSAKADLAKVEQMISEGQWDQAQTQLAEVSSTLQGVNDGGRRQGLQNEVNQLNTKVERRDPHASVPINSLPANSPPSGVEPGVEPRPDLTEPTTPGPVPTTTLPSPTTLPTTTPPTTTLPTTTPPTTTLPTTTLPTTTVPTTTPPSTTASTPSPKATPKLSPSTPAPETPNGPPGATPNSPAAGSGSPAPGSGPGPATPGQLRDSTTGPAAPGTQFSTRPTP